MGIEWDLNQKQWVLPMEKWWCWWDGESWWSDWIFTAKCLWENGIADVFFFSWCSFGCENGDGSNGKYMVMLMGFNDWLVVNGCHEFWMFPLILGCDYHPNWRTHIFQVGVAQPPTRWVFSVLMGFNESLHGTLVMGFTVVFHTMICRFVDAKMVTFMGCENADLMRFFMRCIYHPIRTWWYLVGC